MEEVRKSGQKSEKKRPWETHGQQYVIPVYSEPLILCWHSDTLMAIPHQGSGAGLRQPKERGEELEVGLCPACCQPWGVGLVSDSLAAARAEPGIKMLLSVACK